MPTTKILSDQNHEYFMKQALKSAERAANLGEVPVGALIVSSQGEVLAEAYNQREGKSSALAHAEILAIAQANERLGTWRLTDCTLYVTLEPCAMCAGALWSARIGKVVFGAFDPKAGYLGSLYNLNQDQRLNHQFELVSGVLEDKCADLLKTFFKGLRSRSKA